MIVIIHLFKGRTYSIDQFNQQVPNL